MQGRYRNLKDKHKNDIGVRIAKALEKIPIGQTFDIYELAEIMADNTRRLSIEQLSKQMRMTHMVKCVGEKPTDRGTIKTYIRICDWKDVK